MNMIYELYIELKGIEPRIWRKIQIDANIKLDKLHHVIQVAMGWSNIHLYAFRIGSEDFSIQENEFDDEYQDSKKFGLIEFVGDKFEYTYDFGDDWIHQIKIVQKLKGRMQNAAICLDGRGKCPPEDIGGIHGFKDFLEAMRMEDHPERESYIQWYGSIFDSREFHIHNVNYLFSLI